MRVSASQTLRMATEAVWSHRFRSLLTIIGIVIGITTVVTVSSLLTGLRKGVVTFFEEFGPDNIFVQRFSGDPSGGGSPKEIKRKLITPDYADLIKRFCPTVQDTAVALFIPGVTNGQPLSAKVPGFESDNINLVGVTANSGDLSPRDLAAGRLFTSEEAQRGSRVAMLGVNVAKALFPGGNAVGRTFSLSGAEYTVLGVYTEAKGGFFGENGLDRQITIPLRTAQMRYPRADRYLVTAKAYSGRRSEAFDEIQAVVRKFRHTPANTPNDFNLNTPDQIVKQFDSITGLILLVSIAISGLGLLVGGIGVMNIMLVSVTERTREIGVRKALGARRFDIILQFLLEAITLTGMGGIMGVLISIAVTMLVGLLFPSLPSVVPPWAVVTGFVVSVAIGLFFGVWPAYKASRLDPVEALRYE